MRVCTGSEDARVLWVYLIASVSLRTSRAFTDTPRYGHMQMWYFNHEMPMYLVTTIELRPPWIGSDLIELCLYSLTVLMYDEPRPL